MTAPRLHTFFVVDHRHIELRLEGQEILMIVKDEVMDEDSSGLIVLARRLSKVP